MNVCRKLIWRHRGDRTERRCSLCLEWFGLDQFFINKLNGLARSHCRQCFMAGVVRRKRRRAAQLLPLVYLQKHWRLV